MSNSGIDAITGSFATLSKGKKSLASHAGSAGGSVVATLLLVSQLFGSDIEHNRDSLAALDIRITEEFKSVRREASSSFKEVHEEFHRERIQRVRMEGVLNNIAEKVGAKTSTPEPVIVIKKPVIKFVLPSDTFPVGGVYSVGDTTFIPTLDSSLLARDST